ncbi:zinc finger CCCH domain-containing protein 14 isoform X2 [Phymastichus coffea]|uniref:zinc finger CCCH domain-containing protein 14 isoform X2 n=1 Tax=Phymastichus coffea TaxID=108790 RepID=UPI00273BE57D|nr:zinc finger CCCH domain-containing protein 14 isoform X2 [Phymastichus coffea]
MDIRGVEITNQLRSAIRAKLLELGVRYDEELPDYILVMVVNKKSRQQMNEDLNLFLEDSTEPFVDWLHDQVLKKLQKVTVAKKKINKEIPSVNIKKEEENKVKLENDKSDVANKTGLIAKQDRDREFEELVGDLAFLNEEDHSIESDINKDKSNKKSSSIHSNDSENSKTHSQKPELVASDEIPVKSFNMENSSTPPREVEKSNISLEKTNDYLPNKRTLDVLGKDSHDENLQSSKRKRCSNHFDTEDDRGKSSVNKPKITSIVSLKSRLGVTSPSKKQDLHSKNGTGSRNSPNRHTESKRNENNNMNYSSNRSRSSDRRKPNEDSRNERHRSDNWRKDKSSRSTSLQDNGRFSDKSSTIKSRLGNSNSHKQSRLSLKSSNSSKISKPKISSIRSRLGVRNKSLERESLDLVSDSIRATHNNQNYQEVDDDAESTVNTSLKSQIIAVPKPKSQDSTQRYLSKMPISSKKEESESKNEENDDDSDQCKVPSKVIVTPRPLQPLQALQKRATKSLLLKAVAEANKSVVMQKKVDPCLKKPTSKITVKRDLREGKILSVHLNSKKRMVMEKIQVELDNKHLKNSGKSSSSKTVTDEDFNVVKSLFNRSNDRQRFLVTLNGYNNNIFENQNSDDEKQIDEQMNEDDELPTMSEPYEPYNEGEHIINDESFEQNEEQYYNYYENEENPENQFINKRITIQENDSYQNFKPEENSQKKRKLSPIVYNRSRSNSPNDKSLMSSLLESVLHTDKRPMISSVITTLPDKSGEKCRYWPNCTLGIKCAYYHPEVSCSSFPACKFGDKCAYKHPKCKFGSACTKLNCIFSHPPIQCKYHPYCMKPGCPFSHPKMSTSSISSILSPLTPDLSSVRAKFTWKKKD